MPRRRVPLGAQVATLIRERIAREALAAGDPLPSEAEMAETYGVSQRVVRDALRTLNNQGIIQTRQGKRAVVSELRPVAVQNYFSFMVETDGGAVDELLELRLLLEVRTAELAADRATADDIARMRRLLLELEETGADLPRRVPADIALHDAVARASGNRFFHGILDALTQALFAERRRGGELTQASGSTHDETNEQHEALVEAIAAHDPERAGAAARAIVIRAQEVFAAQRADR